MRTSASLIPVVTFESGLLEGGATAAWAPLSLLLEAADESDPELAQPTRRVRTRTANENRTTCILTAIGKLLEKIRRILSVQPIGNHRGPWKGSDGEGIEVKAAHSCVFIVSLGCVSIGPSGVVSTDEAISSIVETWKSSDAVCYEAAMSVERDFGHETCVARVDRAIEVCSEELLERLPKDLDSAEFDFLVAELAVCRYQAAAMRDPDRMAAERRSRYWRWRLSGGQWTPPDG